MPFAKEAAHFTPEVAQKAFDQFLELYIQPEIERRRASGDLPADVELRGAQIIFREDRKPVVRLNGEVRAIASARFKSGIVKKAGDPVLSNEIDGVQELRLLPDEEAACAHFTALRLGDGWTFAFDFRYNKATAAVDLAKAEEFLRAAQDAAQRGHWAPCADCLFSAAELAAKSVLLVMPPSKMNHHDVIKERFTAWVKNGNAPEEHLASLYKLEKLRGLARYSGKRFAMTESEASKLTEDVELMIRDARARISPREKR